jgi:DNA-directed RNA polymerase specialized sigma24 family protein
MYAFKNDTTTPSASPLPSPIAAPSPQLLRSTLDAVYRERWADLHEIARKHARRHEDPSDAVQDAFVQVLERPPRDTSKRALALALEAAVREACGRHRRIQRDEAAMKIGLRKRFPV